MKAWAVRDKLSVSVWHYDDKPNIHWLPSKKGEDFIIRGNYGCIAEDYGTNTDLEKKIGKKLKHKEIVEIEWTYPFDERIG